MKAAVYCGTQNLYLDMTVAAKSLVDHSDVDVVYFLIEDDRFPYYIPDYVKCINVFDQTYFDHNCSNIYENWTYMVLMRAALTKIFPDLDRIFSLDVDTIVKNDIDELWDLDLDGYFLAGVEEPKKTKPKKPYINMGSVIFNLKKLRDDGMDDKIIEALNTKTYEFAEQDCINELCNKHILTLPSLYNSNKFTEPCENPKIIHFADDKKYRTRALYYQYQNMNWGDARKRL